MVIDNRQQDESYLSLEEVTTEITRVCAILNTPPPDEVVLKDVGSYSHFPRLKEDGKRIELYRCKELSVLTWQIGKAYWSFISSKSSNWLTRHPLAIDTTIVLLGLPNFVAIVVLLSLLKLPLAILTIAAIQIVYLFSAMRSRMLYVERANIITNIMTSIGAWSELEATEFKNDFIGGVFFRALLTSVAILSVVIIMYAQT